jgi:hypothetical protein
VLIGAAAGFLFAWVNMAGWLHVRWQALPPPPEEPIRLLASNGAQLWVESHKGNIFFNSLTSNCTSDCWEKVEDIPSPMQRDEAIVTIMNDACARPLPVIGAEDRLEECHSYMWRDQTYAYVLKANGKVLYWHSTVYGEYIAINFAGSICGGSLIVFLLSLLGIMIRTEPNDDSVSKKDSEKYKENTAAG